MTVVGEIVDLMWHQDNDCSLSLSSKRESDCIVKEVHMTTRATVRIAERKHRSAGNNRARITSYMARMNRDHALCMQHCSLTQRNRADEIKFAVHRILLGNATVPGVMKCEHRHVNLLFRKAIVLLDELTRMAAAIQPVRKSEEHAKGENTRKRKCCSDTPIWLKQWAARPDDIYKHKHTLAICSEDSSTRHWSPEVGKQIGDGYVVVKRFGTHIGIGVPKEREDTLSVLQQHLFRMACNLVVSNKLSLMLFGLLMISIRKFPLLSFKQQQQQQQNSKSTSTATPFFHKSSTALYNLLTVALTVGQFWRADKTYLRI